MEIKNKADLKKVCTERLRAIEQDIPLNYLSLVLKKSPKTKANKIVNVRHGKTHDLGIIELLEQVTKEFLANATISK